MPGYAAPQGPIMPLAQSTVWDPNCHATLQTILHRLSETRNSAIALEYELLSQTPYVIALTAACVVLITLTGMTCGILLWRAAQTGKGAKHLW